jgi:hypothetical protein
MNAPCVYCGKPADTLDHVPPRACFPKPRPKMITVPACLACNNALSTKDEEFASFLSLRVGIDTPATQQLHEKNRRRVARNRRIRGTILANTKLSWVRDEKVIVGRLPVFHWKGDAHDQMIARIIRGLFYHVFKRRLSDEVPVHASWSKPFDDPELYALWVTYPGENLGADGQFRYRYAVSAECPDDTVWMFTFYDCHFATGHTGVFGDVEKG